MVHTSYLHAGLDIRWRKQVIEKSVRWLRKRSADFDAIAFCGVSGALIAPCLADALEKPLILVRKESDGNRHSDRIVEGDFRRRYIIVDDFTASGTTVRHVIDSIAYVAEAKLLRFKPKPVAVFAYYYSMLLDQKSLKLDEAGDNILPVWSADRMLREKVLEQHQLEKDAFYAELDTQWANDINATGGFIAVEGGHEGTTDLAMAGTGCGPGNNAARAEQGLQGSQPVYADVTRRNVISEDGRDCFLNVALREEGNALEG